MTRTRFHHLTVCLLCVFLTAYVDAPPFSPGWWLSVACIAYASQPFYNIGRAWLAAKWRKREPADPYALVGLPEPVDVTHK